MLSHQTVSAPIYSFTFIKLSYYIATFRNSIIPSIIEILISWYYEAKEVKQQFRTTNLSQFETQSNICIFSQVFIDYIHIFWNVNFTKLNSVNVFKLKKRVLQSKMHPFSFCVITSEKINMFSHSYIPQMYFTLFLLQLTSSSKKHL